MSVQAILTLLKPAPHLPEILDKEIARKNYHYWRVRIFYSMYVGYLFYYFTRKSFTFITPFLTSDLGLTKANIGLLASVLSLSYGVSKFLSGILCDRSNPRYFMASGLIFTGICNIFFGLSSSMIFLMIFWGLNGLFQGWGWPACTKQLTHWYCRSERGSWWSAATTSHTVGGFLIAYIAAYSASWWGWRCAMYIPGILCILAGVWLINRLRDVPQSLGLPPIEKFKNEDWSEEERNQYENHASHVKHASQASEANNATQATQAQHACQANHGNPLHLKPLNLIDNNTDKSGQAQEQEQEQEREQAALPVKQILVEQILSNKYVWILAISYFFVYVVRTAVNDWGPLYLCEIKGFGKIEAAACVSWFEVGGFFGILVAGWGSDHWFEGRRVPLMVLSSAGLIFSVMGLWYLEGGNFLAASLLIAGVGFLVFGPQMLVGLAAAEFVDKKAASTSNGFVGCFAYLGAAMAGYPLGKITDIFGWYSFIVTLVLCSTFTLLVLLPVWSVRSLPKTARDTVSKIEEDHLEPA